MLLIALTGELHDLRCASGGITRLRLSHDDSVLFAAAADGCFLVFDVRDRDTTRLGKGWPAQLPRPPHFMHLGPPVCKDNLMMGTVVTDRWSSMIKERSQLTRPSLSGVTHSSCGCCDKAP
jgi:hypothetical protein